MPQGPLDLLGTPKTLDPSGPPKMLYLLRILMFMGKLRLAMLQAIVLLMLFLISMYLVLPLVPPHLCLCWSLSFCHCWYLDNFL